MTVREEETILKEDTQIETSTPVCSHNEWDPLEVKERGKKEGRYVCLHIYHMGVYLHTTWEFLYAVRKKCSSH